MEKSNQKISIIIPCYNEKNTIEKIINKIIESCKYEKEIIVIDDFSSDGSREILERLKESLIDKKKSLLNNPKCLLMIKKNEKISRNEKCPATGKKYKQCCGFL